jgi:hypothetical protein
MVKLSVCKQLFCDCCPFNLCPWEEQDKTKQTTNELINFEMNHILLHFD